MHTHMQSEEKDDGLLSYCFDIKENYEFQKLSPLSGISALELINSYLVNSKVQPVFSSIKWRSH